MKIVKIQSSFDNWNEKRRPRDPENYVSFRSKYWMSKGYILEDYSWCIFNKVLYAVLAFDDSKVTKEND